MQEQPADLIAQQAHLGFGQDVIRVRSFNHFGPGQSENSVCSALAARISRCELLDDESINVGNLEVQRDFTDVRDVVRAYRMLAVAGQAGMVYNVCSGRAVAIAEVAERLLSMATHPMHLETDSALLRPVDVPELRGDPSRLQTTTGWVPAHDLDDTLGEVLDDWRGRLDGYPTAD